MITIDGSFGEGGGQVLRTSLALSLVTRKPFRIENIREGRKKSGLLRQHLTAVNAAVEVGRATVKGNEMGSSELTFEPTEATAGKYRFAVGTAGSATLVLQTVLSALMLGGGPSELLLEGGTHNPWAPPYEFLVKSFMPILNRMGPGLSAELGRPGFYPAGGGKFQVRIDPAGSLSRVDLMERGKVVRQQAIAIVSRLPRKIGERELTVLKEKLSLPDESCRVEEVIRPRGPGNILMVIVESENVTEGFTGFGERGVASDVPVGRYLADQLMVPLALAGGGEFMTLPLSRHSTTNIEVLKRFLDIDVTVSKIVRLAWHVKIEAG